MVEAASLESNALAMLLPLCGHSVCESLTLRTLTYHLVGILLVHALIEVPSEIYRDDLALLEEEELTIPATHPTRDIRK